MGPAWLCTHPPALFGLTPYQVDCEPLGQGRSVNMCADSRMSPGGQSRSPTVTRAGAARGDTLITQTSLPNWTELGLPSSRV